MVFWVQFLKFAFHCNITNGRFNTVFKILCFVVNTTNSCLGAVFKILYLAAKKMLIIWVHEFISNMIFI